jgi:3-deoxy-D-manno-octulosonic-acid transferase
MNLLYRILINLIASVLPSIGIFNKRVKRFLEFRKDTFNKISSSINSGDNHIWIHAASLGEYELAVPFIIKLKKKFKYKIILTFFSESGFKLKKRIGEIDYTFYLPLDTKSNSQKFIKIINPCISVFVKSEIWPNYIDELNHHGSKKYLIEANFKKKDWYFIFFNSWIRNKIKTFDKIFVLDQNSKNVLNENEINNVEIVGSLKIDRVKLQLNLNNRIDKFEELSKNKKIIVCGSTWKEDEEIIIEYIKKNNHENLFWIIAPHNTSRDNLIRIEKNLSAPVSCFSEKKIQSNILLVDTIGDLKKLYSYCKIAYIGGGMGNTGLHNILEACVFDIPVVIGKNYKKFLESVDLVSKGGVISIKNQIEFNNQFDKLITDRNYRQKLTKIVSKYLKIRTGASDRIIKSISL